MFIGGHVSAAGGLHNAGPNGAEIGCEVIQIFSRPPQGGKPREITPEVQQEFKTSMQKNGIKAVYIHAPYFINLASSNPRIKHSSIAVLRQELERGTLLGCKGMMFHPGSSKDLSEEEARKTVIESINKIMDGYTGTCQFLIEISAGAGNVMGDTFEEVALFLNEAEKGENIGVCFDTQHAFASGYDLSTKEGLDTVMTKFDDLIGLNRMPVSHINDSKVELNGKKDRHEHLGEGHIGLDAFKHFINHPKLGHLDLILETPFKKGAMEGRLNDIKLLKQFRNN